MEARNRPIAVGTRGSALALRQAEIAVNALRERFPERQFSVVTVETEGDRIQERPVSQFGDKGVFVRAVERALAEGRVDLAVHSLKDIPTDSAVPGLRLAAFPPREDPRDCLVSRGGLTLDRLRPGARIGTGSVRRRMQLRAIRPDLLAVPIRGNVDTRLRKLHDGQYDAIILAAAGLHRLGRRDVISQYLPIDLFLPDAGQGIIAIQAREGDPAHELASAVDERESRLAATAERRTVRALGADCRSPVGVHAGLTGDRMLVRAVAASEDGAHVRRAEEEGPASSAARLGERLGTRLLALLSA